jgi:hypothetical protein
MTQRTVAMLLTVLLCPAFRALVSAQVRPRIVNPQAIEFDLPLGGANAPNVASYRVDFFEAGANPRRDVPIKSVALPIRDVTDRAVRVDVISLLADMKDGEYVAVLRSDSVDDLPQSEPSAAFVVNHDGLPEDRRPPGPRERFWTKVGLAIAGSLLLVPMLIR